MNIQIIFSQYFFVFFISRSAFRIPRFGQFRQPVTANHHIFGLDVAVNDVSLMRGVERFGDLSEDGNCLPQSHSSFGEPLPMLWRHTPDEVQIIQILFAVMNTFAREIPLLNQSNQNLWSLKIKFGNPPRRGSGN